MLCHLGTSCGLPQEVTNRVCNMEFASVIVNLGLFAACVVAAIIAWRSVSEARQARDEAAAHERNALDAATRSASAAEVAAQHHTTNEPRTLWKGRLRSLSRRLCCARTGSWRLSPIQTAINVGRQQTLRDTTLCTSRSGLLTASTSNGSSLRWTNLSMLREAKASSLLSSGA